MSTEISFAGWDYFKEVDREPDCVKVWHEARHESGRKALIPHTPYEGMTQESFEFHVKNQFRRSGGNNWNHRTIGEHINEYR